MKIIRNDTSGRQTGVDSKIWKETFDKSSALLVGPFVFS